jgi:hypothetical protein
MKRRETSKDGSLEGRRAEAEEGALKLKKAG